MVFLVLCMLDPDTAVAARPPLPCPQFMAASLGLHTCLPLLLLAWRYNLGPLRDQLVGRLASVVSPPPSFLDLNPHLACPRSLALRVKHVHTGNGKVYLGASYTVRKRIRCHDTPAWLLAILCSLPLWVGISQCCCARAASTAPQPPPPPHPQPPHQQQHPQQHNHRRVRTALRRSKPPAGRSNTAAQPPSPSPCGSDLSLQALEAVQGKEMWRWRMWARTC